MLKPSWLKIPISLKNDSTNLKLLLQKYNLCTVCEEANCPNLNECFSKGTATFMIMGKTCTRKCTFCNISHGKPKKTDPEEPNNIAKAIKLLKILSKNLVMNMKLIIIFKILCLIILILMKL